MSMQAGGAYYRGLFHDGTFHALFSALHIALRRIETLVRREDNVAVSSKLEPGFRWFPLHTLLNLPPSDRSLVLRTAPLVAAIRIALWFVPLRRVGALIRMHGHWPFSVPANLSVSRLEWAVRACSRRIPMASCLTQALALQFLLARSGRSSKVHIGVKKDAEAGFQSHAWVECEGQMLLSAPSEVADYSRVLALQGRPD